MVENVAGWSGDDSTWRMWSAELDKRTVQARSADSDSLANCEQSLEAIQAQAAKTMQDALTILHVIPVLVIEADCLDGGSGLGLGEHTAHGEGVVLATLD